MSDFGGSTTPIEIRDQSGTPNYVYDAVNKTFNFVCDIAASAANTKCARYIDAERNALDPDTRWSRGWKWCNPPYSDIGPWVERAAVEGRTVFLIPAYVTTPSWGHVLADKADEIVFLKERINFLRDDGVKMRSNPKGSMLVVFEDGSRANNRYKTSIQSIFNLVLAPSKQ